jgi:4-hydroxy-3-methylbut-2-enyl diphosphate reductase
MKIYMAEKSGFCYGVRNAVKIAENATLRRPGPICTLGYLIHNRFEVRRLEQLGITVKSAREGVERGTLIVRTHGLPKKMLNGLKKKKAVSVIDATCPFVKRIHVLVEDLSSKGYNIIVIGEKNHPETVGIVSYSSTPVAVIESADEIGGLKISPPVAVVSQTTQRIGRFEEMVALLRKKYGGVRVFNTICSASVERQRNAETLARRVEAMVVIGGRDSANTRRLKEICSKYVKTHHVESARELRKEWFKGRKTVGITAGASTPGWLIAEVTGWLKRSDDHARPTRNRGKGGTF